MTPSDMSTIHQAAFTHERGWGADEFTALLAQPYTMSLLPEVVNIYHLAGQVDFMLYIAVRDKDHLRDFVMDHVTKDYVKSLETSLIYDFSQNSLFPIYLDHE